MALPDFSPGIIYPAVSFRNWARIIPGGYNVPTMPLPTRILRRNAYRAALVGWLFAAFGLAHAATYQPTVVTAPAWTDLFHRKSGWTGGDGIFFVLRAAGNDRAGSGDVLSGNFCWRRFLRQGNDALHRNPLPCLYAVRQLLDSLFEHRPSTSVGLGLHDRSRGCRDASYSLGSE